MKKSILAVAVAAILISCGPKPAAISLFNGKDLNGWTAVLEDSTLHPSTEFTVEDGAISLSGKFGYIRTEIPYADYRLNAEWRWPIRRPTAASSCTSSATASGRTATNASYGTAKPET